MIVEYSRNKIIFLLFWIWLWFEICIDKLLLALAKILLYVIRSNIMVICNINITLTSLKFKCQPFDWKIAYFKMPISDIKNYHIIPWSISFLSRIAHRLGEKSFLHHDTWRERNRYLISSFSLPTARDGIPNSDRAEIDRRQAKIAKRDIWCSNIPKKFGIFTCVMKLYMHIYILI